MKLKLVIVSFFMSSSLYALGQKDFNNDIRLFQGDRSYTIIKDFDSLKIAKKPFSIRYFERKYKAKKGKFYAAQIAVLNKPGDLALLHTGQAFGNIPYFAPGTGMAAGKNGYGGTVFISNSGHHYLTYTGKKDRRVDLIRSEKNLFELDWKIATAFYEENEIPLSELKLSCLYFVVLMDRNLNEIIDEGELKIIKLNFK